MANNYFDWTGVLVLDKVTPVIQALFSGADLDATYPGDGEAYICGISEGACLQWDEIHEALIDLAEMLGLDVSEVVDGDLPSCFVLLLNHYGHDASVLEDVLDDKSLENDDTPELATLFELARLLDDGHGLRQVRVEGAQYCSKPRLFEFGGDMQFIGEHALIYRHTSAELANALSLEAFLAQGDLQRAAMALFSQTERILDSVRDDGVRDQLRGMLASLLAGHQPHRASEVSVKVKHWGAYHIEGTVPTHTIDVEDQRRSSGQVYVTAGQGEGDLDEILSITVEVGTNPLNGIDHVPVAHVHFDSDALAFSAFRVGNGIVLRPETDVTLERRQGSSAGDLFWVE